MLTAVANTAGGFDYAGEYYTACCAFLAGTDPSMPSKALIPPNEQNIDRLLKVTGGNSKMHTGEGLITKAKRDRAELQNCYMPLLTNAVVHSYPNIGSGKTWEQIQETFRLRMCQERCRTLLNENLKDVEKALKDAQGRLKSFEDATKVNPPNTVDGENAHATQRLEFRREIEKQEAKLSKVMASIDAGAPGMAPDWYPVEWVAWLFFGPSREFQYGPDSWLSPRNGTYASAGPEPSLHNKEAGKASRAGIPSRQELRRANSESFSPASSVNSSSGTSTPSAPDAVDKLVATLKEANAIEQQRFDNEKQLHEIKMAETKLNNVNAILRNPPPGLNKAQLDRLQAQALYLTGIVTGLDLGDSGPQQPISRSLIPDAALAPAAVNPAPAPAPAPSAAALTPAVHSQASWSSKMLCSTQQVNMMLSISSLAEYCIGTFNIRNLRFNMPHSTSFRTDSMRFDHLASNSAVAYLLGHCITRHL